MNKYSSRSTDTLFLFLVITLFTACTSDEQGKITDAAANLQLKPFSREEFGEKIKDLLLKRPERPETPDLDLDFEKFFGELDSLALKMPDDFEFDVRLYGPPESHPTSRNKKAMECLTNGNQFKHFLQRVHTIVEDLKEEFLEDLTDSKETDENSNLQNDSDKDDNDDDDDDNNKNNSKVKDDGLGNNEVNKKSDNSTEDSEETDTTTNPPDSQDDSKETTSISSLDIDMLKGRRKRDTEQKGFDLDEVLDRLEDDDTECLTAFVSQGDKKFLCQHFSHRSSAIFAKLMAAGTTCYDYLVDKDDDDSDDRLDVSHQMAIYKQLRDTDSKEVSDDEVKKLLRLAPDVIDDDFLEDVSEELFKQNLHQFGRLAAGQTANPRLRYAFRSRVETLGLNTLSSDDIQKLGPGLFSLSFDQLENLNGKSLLDAAVNLFSDDSDDSKEQETDQEKKVEKKDDEKDDDEDDDKSDVRLVIGHHLKQAIIQNGMQRDQIGRNLRYLHHDLGFVRSLDPDDLLDALKDVYKIRYDFDDAHSVMNLLARSSRFPPAALLSGQNLTRLGNLMVGLDVEFLSQLRKNVVEEALDDLNDIDFDDHQAYQLLEKMGYADDQMNFETVNVQTVRSLGTLFRGMPAENILKMKKDVIEEALDDFDDLDLSDAAKKTIVDKVRNNDRISPKLLNLKHFAEAISLDDLYQLDDDDVVLHLNVSSRVRWSLPQAALLAHKYRVGRRSGRMRPSDLAQLRLLALGVLPDDLNEMMKTEDDVLDIADELKSIQDDLTLGQIDEITEAFEELSSLGSKKIIIDEIKAMQSSHILAYLKPEIFEKLEFTESGKMVFIAHVAKMRTHKMSREHLQYLAKKIMDMIEDTDSAESKNEKTTDRESRQLRSLGQIALGLTPAQLRGFSGKAIIDNLDILRNMALSTAQAKAVLETLNSLEKWRCNINILARLGPLLQHHDDLFDDDCDTRDHSENVGILLNTIKGFEKRREAIQERLEEGFRKEDDSALDDDEEKKFVNRVVAMATQKLNVRKRQAVPFVGALSCDILIRLGDSARLLEPQLLATLPNEELKRCLPQLGSISDWSPENIQILIGKIKSIFAGISSWPSKVIAASGSLIAGLSPAEINMLSGLHGVGVMSSIGRHGRLSNEQLKFGFSRWMELSKKSDVKDISPVEFSSLSEFVCGLEVKEISKLPDVTFKRALSTIGQSRSCTQEQREAYANKAVAVYGSQISRWTPAVVADMGHLFGALGRDHIKKLNSKQLSLVSPKTIESVPSNKIAVMSADQLAAFSTNQANAVTTAQYQALTAEQRKVLDSKATVRFSHQDGRPENGRNAGNALTNAWHGLIPMIAVFLPLLV